jgi:hypothetical protein
MHPLPLQVAAGSIEDGKGGEVGGRDIIKILIICKYY